VEADVVVVGGGFSGLGAAWAAAEAGASTVLLEARTIASGASGRNAGFLLSGPSMGFAASVAAVGLLETIDMWNLTDRNHELMVSLLEDMDLDCGYLRRGSMSLAASETEWEALQAECADMQAAGLNACPVSSSSLPRPFDRLYQGGVYYPGNAEINPGIFLRAMARRMSERVVIFETSTVAAIDSGSTTTVQCATGTVVAQRVVLATNAYTASLLPWVPIAPTRGQVASTQPRNRVIVPFPMYADRGFQYWRQTPEGHLVVGGWRNLDLEREVGAEESLSPSIHAALDRFVTEVSAGARAERRWAGIMGFTPDHFPLVGAVPGREGLWIAAGYSGHGVAMAFLCGALAARGGLGEDACIPEAFNPQRYASS
jgi:glycine/D-amino acid oxidase-like deaminating enzyme